MTRMFYASKMIGVSALGLSQLLLLAGCDGDAYAAANVPDLNGVAQLSFEGDGELEFRQGAPGLNVVSEDADEIEITRSGAELRIKVPRRVDGTPQFTLTLPQLAGVELSGAARIRTSSWKTPQLTIRSSGAGEFVLSGLTVDELKVTSSGASDFTLAGVARDQDLQISGASDYDAHALRARTVAVDVSGAGHVQVHAETTLKLNASGVGALEYTGNPQVDQDVSGVFSVKHREG